MANIGYIRVSSNKQTLEHQRFEEEISQKIYNLGGYAANVDKDGWSYNSPRYSESGNDFFAVSTYANKQDKQKAKKDIQKANDIWHFYDKQR